MNGVKFLIEPRIPRVAAQIGGEKFPLPALWLRERCQDAAHVDPQTQQRLFNPHELPADLALTDIGTDDAGNLWLTFSDGYHGRYDMDVLAQDFDPLDRLPAMRPWNAELDRGEVTFDWPALAEDAMLHAALGAFLERGFLILRNVPTDRERILEVAATFGHTRHTNFGRYFEVYSRPVANDLAYGSAALAPHTDNPYRDPVPGIQILHCLTNETRGGLSTLADSLSAGQQLATEDPQGFELLATTPVRFRFIDANEDMVERRPIIRRNALGEMTGVHYSPRLDYMPLFDEAGQREFHRLRQRLGTLLADPRLELRFALQAGELLLFDNCRVVHGRTAFDAGEGLRHLQGCYIDIDEPRSRYRALSRRLAARSCNTETS